MTELYKEYMQTTVLKISPLSGISNDVFLVKDKVYGDTVGKIFPTYLIKNPFIRNENHVFRLMKEHQGGNFRVFTNGSLFAKRAKFKSINGPMATNPDSKHSFLEI